MPKTTAQLDTLLAESSVVGVELAVSDLSQAAVANLLGQTERALASGRDVVVYTSRQLVTGADAAESLRIGADVSRALVSLLQGLNTRPRYLVAKGGITSSDLASRGLGVRRALVRGQILPGVPVWEVGPETKFPGVPYVVFPGNVGGMTRSRRCVRSC